jgi:hypothetical protein
MEKLSKPYPINSKVYFLGTNIAAIVDEYKIIDREIFYKLKGFPDLIKHEQLCTNSTNKP